jgi:DNA-directed RNA polymerase beta subunit
MAQSFTGKKRIRKSFGRIPEAVQMPNLIEVQRSSYEQFLQREVRPGVRKDEGIEAVFKSSSRSRTSTSARCSNTSRTNSKSPSTTLKSASSAT